MLLACSRQRPGDAAKHPAMHTKQPPGTRGPEMLISLRLRNFHQGKEYFRPRRKLITTEGERERS